MFMLKDKTLKSNFLKAYYFFFFWKELQLISIFLGSSSSGRMSTASGCSGTSLGDSGTHSDTEDRRVGIFEIIVIRK